MLNDPRSQEIEAGEHQGQRKKDGDESSGQNSGSDVGAETTLIHEKPGTENEWEAAPGLQDCRAPLSASVTSPETAQTADAAQADASTEAEAAGLRESPHQLVHPSLKTGALHRRVFVWAVPHGHAPVPPSQPPKRLYWAGNSSEVPVTNKFKQLAKGQALGHDEFMWPVTPPHNVCRQTVVSDLYVDEVLKRTAASAMMRRKERTANSNQTSVRHVTGCFPEGRRPGSQHHQDPEKGARSAFPSSGRQE